MSTVFKRNGDVPLGEMEGRILGSSLNEAQEQFASAAGETDVGLALAFGICGETYLNFVISCPACGGEGCPVTSSDDFCCHFGGCDDDVRHTALGRIDNDFRSRTSEFRHLNEFRLPYAGCQEWQEHRKGH